MIPEKLIEEIATLAIDYRWHPGANRRIGQRDKDFAQILFARILSAVRDGRLDEEWGVVGRDVMADFVTDGFDEGIAMEGSLRYELKPGDTIIALRPEGHRSRSLRKEEEGDAPRRRVL